MSPMGSDMKTLQSSAFMSPSRNFDSRALHVTCLLHDRGRPLVYKPQRFVWSWSVVLVQSAVYVADGGNHDVERRTLTLRDYFLS